MDENSVPEISVEISAAEMLRIRDRVRRSLVTEFHELNISMRARRKVGDIHAVRRLQLEIHRIVTMIHSLDNPMDEDHGPDSER
jgi:hypothetical protein